MPRMTLGQAVRDAIEGERQAARLYALLAMKAAPGEARTFLEDMSAQEAQHQLDLERFAESLEQGSVPATRGADLGEVASALPPVPVEGLAFEAALSLAIEAETHAHALYGIMATRTRGMVSQFFQRMAAAELQHSGQLQALLDATRAVG